MTTLSAVVPAYNEASSLPIFYNEFSKIAHQMHSHHEDLNFELVIVNDGSEDGTLSTIKKLETVSNSDSLITLVYLSFSRNFGKEAALCAGLEAASGELVATMDADMQDPPSLLPEMYDMILSKDCDNVAAKRSNRKGEPPIRSFFARMFYRIANRLSDIDFVDGMRDFRLMKRPMVDAVLSLKESNRFSKGIYSWVGFQTEWLEYEHVERVAGDTKWSFFSLFLYSIEGIVAFSTAPLTIASIIGLIMCLIAIVVAIVIIIRTLLFGDPVSGWPSLSCIILFVGGLQLFCLGIIGQYLAKAYLEAKNRPLYIIAETNADKTHN